MGRRMISNIEAFVDFDKLRSSNNLGHKWSKKFQIHSTRYMRFIIDCKNNPETYLALLSVDADKKEFLHDLENMFYALEVENLLVEQFHNAIISILKRLGVDSRHYEDYISHGLLAIRSSVWMYRLTTTKFSSFAYNGIYNRILGLISRKSGKEKKQQRRTVQIVNLSDLHSDLDTGRDWYEEASIDKEPVSYSDDQPLNMDELVQMADLTSEEILLLDFFLMKAKGVIAWNKLYRAEVLKQTGQKLTKQGVAWRLRHLQIKMMNAIKTIKGEEYQLPFAMSA